MVVIPVEDHDVCEREGYMVLYRHFMVGALVCSLISICWANSVVQTAAKTALKDVNGTSLGKLYKVRSQAVTPERKDVLIKACVAGLYAIGDQKNARKISDGLEVDDFLGSFMDDCSLCKGEGTSSKNCYKCKGTGECQNSGCHEGKVIVQGFNGNHAVRVCSICKGTGKCARCEGKGNTAENCSRCRGMKKSANKEKALTACKELLETLTTPHKEVHSAGKKGAEGSACRQGVPQKEVHKVTKKDKDSGPPQEEVQEGVSAGHGVGKDASSPRVSDEVRSLQEEEKKARRALEAAEKKTASARRALNNARNAPRRSGPKSVGFSDGGDFGDGSDCEKELDALREAEKAESNARGTHWDAKYKLAQQQEKERKEQEKRNKERSLMGFIQQGLSENLSSLNEKFAEHRFDFKTYYQWKDDGATSVQKERIFGGLTLNGFKSDLYKDYVRCCFALVPDGLSFAVRDITEGNLPNGERTYNVSIELLYYDCSYPGSEDKWKGNPLQSSDVIHYLRDKLLLDSYLTLVIRSTSGSEVEKWRKGTILVSKGWIYDVLVIDAIETFKDGSRRVVKDVHRSEQVYRSMDERLGFDPRLKPRVSFFE